MKTFEFNFKTIVILIITGLTIGYFGRSIYEFLFKPQTVRVHEIISILSLVLLLLLCLVGARVILWSYSQTYLPQNKSNLIFGVGLILILLCFALRLWFVYQEYQYLLLISGDIFSESEITSIWHINFIQYGLWMVLLITGNVSVIFLWIAYWQKRNHGHQISKIVSNLNLIALMFLTIIFWGSTLIRAIWFAQFILFLRSLQQNNPIFYQSFLLSMI